MVKREVIGVPECPLVYRWTFLHLGQYRFMLHYFLPTSRDRDHHDHPRSFVTFVFWGHYRDEHPDGTVDVVRAPAIRYRSATHTHKTVAGKRGAWTLVIMGPKVQPWGFLHDGRWWPWRQYEEKFGHGFRCEDQPRD